MDPKSTETAGVIQGQDSGPPWMSGLFLVLVFISPHTPVRLAFEDSVSPHGRLWPRMAPRLAHDHASLPNLAHWYRI